MLLLLPLFHKESTMVDPSESEINKNQAAYMSNAHPEVTVHDNYAWGHAKFQYQKLDSTMMTKNDNHLVFVKGNQD